MTKIFDKIFLIITVVVVLTMTGCLKDADYSNNKFGTKNTQNQNFVEIHLTSSENSNDVTRSFPSMDRDTTVTQLIPINLTSGPASSDVKVTFELLDSVNSVKVDTFVKHHYLIPDPAKFVVQNPGNQVTIPAGSSTGYVSVKFNPKNFAGDTYIFAIRITAVSDSKYTISNLNEGYVTINVANQWEASYLMSGYVLRAGDPVLSGYFSNVPWKLSTTGKKTLVFWKTQIWADGSTVGGINPWILTIDDSAGPNSPMPVTVKDPINKAVKNNPAYNSRYEPSTKTFYLSVYWGSGPTNRAAVDTLVYSGRY